MRTIFKFGNFFCENFVLLSKFLVDMVAVSKFLNFCPFVAVICYRLLFLVSYKNEWITPIPAFYYRNSNFRWMDKRVSIWQNYSSNIMFDTKFLPVSRTSHCFVRGCVVYIHHHHCYLTLICSLTFVYVDHISAYLALFCSGPVVIS